MARAVHPHAAHASGTVDSRRWEACSDGRQKPANPGATRCHPVARKKKKKKPALKTFFFFFFPPRGGGRLHHGRLESSHPAACTCYMHARMPPICHARALTPAPGSHPREEKKIRLGQAPFFFFFFLPSGGRQGRQRAMGMQAQCRPPGPMCTPVSQQQQRGMARGRREKSRQRGGGGRRAGGQPLGRAAGRFREGPRGLARARGGGWQRLAVVVAMKSWQSPL